VRRARQRHRRFLDARLVVRLQVAQQPPCRDPRPAPRVLLRDQRSQRERLDERDPPDLAGGGFGDEQVAALDRLVEDRPRMALRGDDGSVPGQDGLPRLP
jgi:hypothetical protein